LKNLRSGYPFQPGSSKKNKPQLSEVSENLNFPRFSETSESWAPCPLLPGFHYYPGYKPKPSGATKTHRNCRIFLNLHLCKNTASKATRL
jgi:hypothetical protein